MIPFSSVMAKCSHRFTFSNCADAGERTVIGMNRNSSKDN